MESSRIAFGKMGMWVLFAFVLVSACRRVESTQEPETLELEGDAAVFAALCRFWDRCRKERLELFSSGTVEQCINYYSCASVVSSEQARSSFVDRAGCTEFIDNASCDSGPAAVSPIPDDGLNTFTVVGLPFAKWYPLDSVTEYAACAAKGWPRGDAKAGEACFVYYQACEAGYYCKPLPGEEMIEGRFCGVCVSPSAVGEMCDPSTACAAGSLCQDGVCTALFPLDTACTSNTICSSGACVSGACAAPGDIGAPCDDGGDCISTICNKQGRCDELVLGKLGESCGNENASVPINCDPDLGLTCVDERCIPLADRGEPCQQHDNCRLDLLCIEGTCQQKQCPGAEGANCDVREETCGEYTFCEWETQTCMPRNTLGERCVSSRECEAGLICDDTNTESYAYCAAPREVGTACSADGQCIERICENLERQCEFRAPEIIFCEATPCEDCGTCAPQPDIEVCSGR